MGYSKRYRLAIPVQETDIATADTLIAWTVIKPCAVYSVGFLITTTIVADDTSAILSIRYTASGGTIATKDTITLVDDEAAGVEKAGAGASTMPFAVGDSGVITLAVTTAGVDAGSEAGDGYWILYITENSDGSL